MPHDRDGNLVQVGDRVLIEATVSSVQQDDKYCNATVVTVCPMPPYAAGTSLTLNTKQLRVVPKPDQPVSP